MGTNITDDTDMDEPDEDLTIDIEQINRIEQNIRDKLGDEHECVDQIKELRKRVHEYNNASEDDNKFGMILKINFKVNRLKNKLDSELPEPTE